MNYSPNTHNSSAISLFYGLQDGSSQRSVKPGADQANPDKAVTVYRFTVAQRNLDGFGLRRVEDAARKDNHRVPSATTPAPGSFLRG
jgi:hypothetical protein